MYYDENSKEFALYNNRKEEFGRGADIATLFQSKSSQSINSESEIFMLRINSNHNKLQSLATVIKQATDYRWSKPQLNQLINAKKKKIKSNNTKQQAILKEIKTNNTNQQFNNMNNNNTTNSNSYKNNNNTTITNSNNSNKNIINFNFIRHPQQQQQQQQQQLLQMQLLYQQQQQLQMQIQMHMQMQMQMQMSMQMQTATQSSSSTTTTQENIHVKSADNIYSYVYIIIYLFIYLFKQEELSDIKRTVKSLVKGQNMIKKQIKSQNDNIQKILHQTEKMNNVGLGSLLDEICPNYESIRRLLLSNQHHHLRHDNDDDLSNIIGCIPQKVKDFIDESAIQTIFNDISEIKTVADVHLSSKADKKRLMNGNYPTMHANQWNYIGINPQSIYIQNSVAICVPATIMTVISILSSLKKSKLLSSPNKLI